MDSPSVNCLKPFSFSEIDLIDSVFEVLETLEACSDATAVCVVEFDHLLLKLNPFQSSLFISSVVMARLLKKLASETANSL